MAKHPTITGYVDDWTKAQRRVKTLRRQYQDAIAEERLTNDALGKVIAPDDAQTGEQFQVWVNFQEQDRMLCCRVGAPPDGGYTLWWRDEGEPD